MIKMLSQKLTEATKKHFGAVINKDVEKIIDFYSKSEELLVLSRGCVRQL